MSGSGPRCADRGLPQVLDFPYQQLAVAYAAGVSGAKGLAHRLEDGDYFRTANGIDPAFPTFLGNHDMGRGAQQIIQQSPGVTGAAIVQRVLLGYDLLYLLRGAPTVLYGEEVGMIGSGGDQAAREDMFPTQVTDWQTEARVGSPPIGKGSSFDVTGNPVGAQMQKLAAVRDAHPELATGASVVRFAKDAVLVVSRIDFATGREVVTAFNNGAADARVTVTTATAGAWSVAFGTGGATGGAGTSLALDVPAVSALVAVPAATLPQSAPARPVVSGRDDDLTSLYRLGATLKGVTPVSVSFAIRRHGGTWQRVAIDDTSPYRAFLEPARFARHERVEAIAVARGAGGATSISQIATVRPNG
jgi:alpha-amylase